MGFFPMTVFTNDIGIIIKMIDGKPFTHSNILLSSLYFQSLSEFFVGLYKYPNHKTLENSYSLLNFCT
ncbi:hypothetical protein GCM10023142_03630 [Anaerocolumna aminovalerica]